MLSLTDLTVIDFTLMILPLAAICHMLEGELGHTPPPPSPLPGGSPGPGPPHGLRKPTNVLLALILELWVGSLNKVESSEPFL